MPSTAYEHFPVEGIGLDDYDRLLTWLATFRDPVLWHQMACGLFFESAHVPDYLLWIVQQPDCDRATAAATFVQTLAYETLYLEDLRGYERIWPLAEEICSRAQAGRYVQRQLPDPSPLLETSLDEARLRLETGCQRRNDTGQDPRLPIPLDLFASPYPQADFTPRYLIEQDAIVRIDSLDDRAREILGYTK